MTSAQVRKNALRVFLAFLTITAIVAIVTLVSGEFGKLEVKILVTSLSISAASVCAMSCAAFIEKRRGLGFGTAGITLAIAGAVLVIFGLWTEQDSDPFWKTTATCAVLAVGMAHGFLLALPDLERRHRWVQSVTAASIVVLSAMIVLALWAEIEDQGYYRFLSAVAVVVGLETLAIPILMRLRKGEPGSLETLVLERIEEGIYRDRGGTTYRVTPVDD